MGPQDIASHIKAEVEYWQGIPYGNNQLRALKALALRIGIKFKQENPEFNQEGFLLECGIPSL